MPNPKLPKYHSSDSDSEDSLECTCYSLDVLSTDDESSEYEIPVRAKRKPTAAKYTKSYVFSDSEDEYGEVERKKDRISELYDRVNRAQTQRMHDNQRFKEKSAKTRVLISELVTQLKDAQEIAEQKSLLATQLRKELQTTGEMEAILREQEKILQEKEMEVNELNNYVKKTRKKENEAADKLRDRYEREKLRRRILEEDILKQKSEEQAEKDALAKELQISRDLEQMYRKELCKTRDQLNTSESILQKQHDIDEQKKKDAIEREKLRLRNMQDDVYRIQHQYQLEHLLNQAQEKLIGLRPYLGVCFTSQPRRGTMLQMVRVGHAGYLCGLRTNDVILSVNSTHTNTKSEFYSSLFGLAPGDKFNCTVFRQAEGVTKTFRITMGSSKLSLPKIVALRRLIDGKSSPNTEQFEADIEEAGLDRNYSKLIPLSSSVVPTSKKKRRKKKKVSMSAWSDRNMTSFV